MQRDPQGHEEIEEFVKDEPSEPVLDAMVQFKLSDEGNLFVKVNYIGRTATLRVTSDVLDAIGVQEAVNQATAEVIRRFKTQREKLAARNPMETDWDRIKREMGVK